MKNTTFKITHLLFFLLLIVSACKKDDMPDIPDDPKVIDNPMPATFQEVIDAGGGFEEPVEEQTSNISDVYFEEINGVTWECTKETISVKGAAGGNNSFLLFSPDAGPVFIGNMLQGKTLEQAPPDPIVVNRAGGKFAINIVAGSIQPSFEVSKVTQSEVASGVQNALAASSEVYPNNFSLTIKNIQTREQLAFELGLNINSAFTDIESKLNYDSNSDKNTFLVVLNQFYYNLSFDIPSNVEDFFDPSVNPEDLANYVGAGNPAAYVSDVTYGRVFYMLFSSSSSNADMEAAINTSFSGVFSGEDAYIETSYLSQLEELNTNLFAFGNGFSSTNLTITNGGDLSEFEAELEKRFDIEAGKPISYTLRSVYDHRVVSLQLSSEYEVTNCKPKASNGAPPYTEHWTGKVIAAMGPVGAAFNTYGTDFVLINKTGDQFMRSSLGVLEGPFPIDQLGIEPCPFDGIGAACNIDGNQNGDYFLQIFDVTGTQFAYFKPTSGTYLDARSITELGDGDNPFIGVGIGAVAFRHKDPLGPASRYIFNKNGDKYSAYLNNPNSFGTTYNLFDWGPDGSITEHFDRVGAAIGFYIGSTQYFILFNDLGTQYVYYGDLNGNGIEVIGPFDL